MSYRLYVFDMDGTILNTLEDLADSLNYALARHQMPARTIDEVKTFVGNGIRRLVELGVAEGTSEEVLEQVLATFAAHYKIHCADKTAPYKGVVDVLRALKAQGKLLAVVSNKADFAVQELCKQYFDGIFDIAVGERPEINKKPAADMVNLVLNQLGISKAEAVYIGDSEVDLKTAENSLLPCVAVGWGFRDAAFLKECGATDVVEKVEDLLAALI